MVAEKIFDSPEARYNYARFPRASKNFSSGMWLPIKSASMPKFDPMHRICQSPINCKPAFERDLGTNSLTIGRD